MKTIATPLLPTIRLPRWRFAQMFNREHRRRRRVMIDLIHASPHLLRDIGLVDGNAVERGR